MGKSVFEFWVRSFVSLIIHSIQLSSTNPVLIALKVFKGTYF